MNTTDINASPTAIEIEIESITMDDLDAIVAMEEACFEVDRLSRRALRLWIQRRHRVMLVARLEGRAVGYILIIHHQGTRLGRLYSIAVDPQCRRMGLARCLLATGEEFASKRGCIDLRLEVSHQNPTAIGLYRSLGYIEFGIYRDYYEDHSDALRMEKRILYPDASARLLPIMWVQQQTDFTCGPASLLMALHHFIKGFKPDLSKELQIWKEATTIFMTSGHGGCHPLGLALAAQQRGLDAEVWVSEDGPLFVEGVRDPLKKRVMSQVDRDLRKAAREGGLVVHKGVVQPHELEQHCRDGRIALLLISTWRLDNKKAAHWVVVTGYDDHCFYLHDPDPGPNQRPVDCQHCPIAKKDLEKMSRFGRQRLQTVVLLGPPHHNKDCSS